MKTNLPERTDISFGATEEIAVTIATNAVSFMASTVGLAKDKVGYPLREICSNAWDAAGGDFTVHLPTKLDPVFKVRDFGPGMDHAAMAGRYAVLYESTKRDDDTKVGSWGAGRFSPFAYLQTTDGTAPYTVTSWTGGRSKTYVVSMGTSGAPVIRLIADVESDELTGMEVAFAVREADIPTFHDRAREILWGFQPRPAITPACAWSDTPVRLSGEGWTLYEYILNAQTNTPLQGPSVRMGCAVYPIDLRECENPGSFIQPSDRILFEAPIGSLSPTLSREALAYDDRTKATLNRLIAGYKDAYVASVQVKVDAQASYFAACRVVDDLGNANAVRPSIAWRGKPVKLYVESVLSGIEHAACSLDHGWSNAQHQRFDSSNSIRLSRMVDRAIVLEHSPGHSITKLKMAGLEGRGVLWIRCRRLQREAVLAALGNPQGPIFLDDVKVGGTPGRAATLRRRRTLRIDARGQIHQETRDVDLSHNLVVIGGMGEGHYATADLGSGATMRTSEFRESVRFLRQIGCLPEEMIVLVKTPSEHVQPHWSWFSTWAASSLRPIARRFQPTGFEELNTGSFGRRLSWLSALPDHLVQALPGEMRDVTREAVSLRARISQVHEPDQLQAYRAHKELCRYDPSARQQARSLNPIRPVEERINAVCERYPLFGLIADHGAERAWRVPTEGHGSLAEYARLLRMSGAFDDRERQDPNQREAA